MEKRIRAIPHGLRDIRMIRSVSEKLCQSLLDTLPPEKCESVLENGKRMIYDIHFNQFASDSPTHGFALVNGNDLETLIHAVHDYHCFGCGKKCGSCDIGKAFDHIMVQCRKSNESWEFIDLRTDLMD